MKKLVLNVVGLVALAGLCTCPVAANELSDIEIPQPSSFPMIDHMEHLQPGQILSQGDRWGVWYAVNDGTCEQTPIPFGHIGFTTDAYEGMFALNTQGGACSDWGAVFGFTLQEQRILYRLPYYDASDYEGIEFYAKVDTTSGDFLFSCHDKYSHPDGGFCDEANGECWMSPVVNLDVRRGWGHYVILWSDFERPPWSGVNEPLDTATLYACQFVFQSGDAFDLTVDNVSFVEGPH